MSSNIIDLRKMREAAEASEATAKLHQALCIAADATATGALCLEGRLQLLAALLPAFAPGWTAKLVPDWCAS